jgi:hypothetical protein
MFKINPEDRKATDCYKYFAPAGLVRDVATDCYKYAAPTGLEKKIQY